MNTFDDAYREYIKKYKEELNEEKLLRVYEEIKKETE